MRDVRSVNLSESELKSYHENGYLVIRGLFSTDEILEMIEHYMKINQQGAHPGDFAGVPRKTQTDAYDPLQQYPRLIQMHYYDDKTKEWMLDSRLTTPISAFLGQKAVLTQTMLYFKPPGARGQSFHQDNLYLRTTPLAAAWVALDPADEENGTMLMAPGSHKLGLLPRVEADTDLSFTAEGSYVPEGIRFVPVILEPGDVLFFSGLTLHGSLPNKTSDRFRRAFICHYEGEASTKLEGESQLH
ncbi:MAG TPA: phytanoyl-CoA dioxygenase family protein [Fimbriimonadales bacterium]|nr:phytanoyl-CoA dioxygenase family protein [Fimbriimonadales bacterium]